MIILAHPDFWIEYLNNRNEIDPSENYIEIFNIIINTQNGFAYNHLWSDFYESFLLEKENESIDYIDAFNNIIVELNYKDRLIKEDSDSILNVENFYNCFLKSSIINFFRL